jgi:hypothetical protein
VRSAETVEQIANGAIHEGPIASAFRSRLFTVDSLAGTETSGLTFL